MHRVTSRGRASHHELVGRRTGKRTGADTRVLGTARVEPGDTRVLDTARVEPGDTRVLDTARPMSQPVGWGPIGMVIILGYILEIVFGWSATVREYVCG